MAELMSLFFVILVVVVVAGLAALLIAKNLIYICGPNEVLVFSGGRHVVGGLPRGFRIIKGGRGIRVPLLETVDRVDLTNMIIEVSVTNAYSKGGIPLSIHGVANVKVAGHDPQLSNAIERFLTRDRKEIIAVAKDTLEGNLRGVLSQLTPEEVNQDKIAFAEKLLDEAEHDLSKLGLALDTLKIQNVSDEVGYLNSIGRKQSAEVIKKARIAEARAKATSTIRDAENTQRARLAAIDAKMRVVEAETTRRIMDAQTKKDAMVAQEVGQIRARIARATADLKVQEARVEQVRRQLMADIIAPARAEMEASQAEAKGRAASITEDGKATVAVLEEMIATWKRGGESARDIFLMQKMQTLMASLVGTIEDVKVDKVTLLPAVGGDSSAAVKAVRLVEELKGTLGVDLPALLEQAAAGRGALPARPAGKPAKT